MRMLIVGYGKMGKMVESLAPEYGFQVAGLVDPLLGGDGIDSEKWQYVDVALDFSSPPAVAANVSALARRRINIVIGTTGWASDEPKVRAVVADTGIGVVAAPNFSTGVVLFDAIVASAAAAFAGQ